MKRIIYLFLFILFSSLIISAQEGKDPAIVFYKKEKHVLNNRIKDIWKTRGIILKQNYYYRFRLNNGNVVFGRIYSITDAKVFMTGILSKPKNTWILNNDSISFQINNVVGILLIADDLNTIIKDVSLRNYSYKVIEVEHEYYPVSVTRQSGNKIKAFPCLTINGVGFIHLNDSVPHTFAVKPFK